MLLFFFCFFFSLSPSAASQIITGPLYHPHLTFCGSQPQSRFFFFFFFFFISQRREFESQPTQTTFTVWQMKLINNLKHALAEAHTIMSLNMFLPAAEMHLNYSPHIPLQSCTSKANIISVAVSLLHTSVSFFTPPAHTHGALPSL